MSEAKFTKGPWTMNLEGWRGMSSCMAAIDADTHGCLAEVVVKMEDDLMYRSDLLANAHLIAAAPEMYGLLEKLVNPDNCKKDIVHIIGSAENLLAKARGETA